ncbi:hypothetical protein F0223_15225 [Vibrio coralliilyticus]|uniref:hypothetical protein n=1 Tax=Vibrio coralliilyticus TaxID=190893 RepID=UPI00148C5821|nr:hypothetical protein [Vibrio coralliilyticus]
MVEAKGSCEEVKNQTMNDVLTLHCVPIELMSVRRESIISPNEFVGLEVLLLQASQTITSSQFKGKVKVPRHLHT